MTSASDTTPPAESYAEAVAEVDRILEALEDDAVDVDVLADQVRRASELLRFCRERIRAATDDVAAAVAALEDMVPPAES